MEIDHEIFSTVFLSLSVIQEGQFLAKECAPSTGYGKCSKTSNTNVSDKMTYANSADPDQTAPEGAV